MKSQKGCNCSKKGNEYEIKVFNVIKKTSIYNQVTNNLGGSSSRPDLSCKFNENPINIEIKKYNTPDWKQASIKYNKEEQQWSVSNKTKMSTKATFIFNKLLNNINLYDGQIPPCILSKMTYTEWIKIKKETDIWSDFYIDIPNDTISKLYYTQNNSYIQISDGYGLYHLGNDICNFNVPLFNPDQRLRIRTKVHTTKDSKGFCQISVMAACQPKNIRLLERSNHSLDDLKLLPTCINYNNF